MPIWAGDVGISSHSSNTRHPITAEAEKNQYTTGSVY